MDSVITHAKAYAAATPGSNASLWQIAGARLIALRLCLGAAARAHERRRTFESVGADTLRDLNVAPETATGLSGWQADLPFFMQSDFGSR